MGFFLEQLKSKTNIKHEIANGMSIVFALLNDVTFIIFLINEGQILLLTVINSYSYFLSAQR
jgi:hypothetical protein